MLALLRRALIRRLLVAVVLGAFLPVAGATIACQVHCAGEELQLHRGSHHGQHHVDTERPASVDLARYLTHAGPCHLSTVPVVPETVHSVVPQKLERAWRPATPAAYVSFVCPPPEHRPRG
jgi:hypothetical protein